MSRQEILERAIQKAIDGGWTVFGLTKTPNLDLAYLESRTGDLDAIEFFTGLERVRLPIHDVIFNHAFAKALWGKTRVAIKQPGVFLDIGAKWQYQLQCMVIADDPIRYLGDHFDD